MKGRNNDDEKTKTNKEKAGKQESQHADWSRQTSGNNAIGRDKIIPARQGNSDAAPAALQNILTNDHSEVVETSSESISDNFNKT